jgi:hypothetical protein
MKVGEGGFGRVWFQTNEAGDVRALKEIRKDMAPAPIDYRRELEAAFKFSHSKVSQLHASPGSLTGSRCFSMSIVSWNHLDGSKTRRMCISRWSICNMAIFAMC